MECFKCHAESSNGSKFCSNCGKSFQNTVVRGESDTSTNSKKEAWSHPESIAAYKSIKNGKLNTNLILYGVTILSMIIFSEFGLLVYTFSGLLVLAFFMYNLSYDLNSTEYYSIKYSKVDGQHRCIYCGNKGIYKSTVYKEGTLISKCSSCQKFLFSS